jgi:hypothetical protein
MGFVLYVSGFEEFLQSLPQEGSLFSVSEDAQSIQDALLYPAAASTLEAHMPQRGSLDNDTNNDGSDDGVAYSLVGLAPTLIFIPLIVSTFLAPLYELPKKSQNYSPILERPG